MAYIPPGIGSMVWRGLVWLANTAADGLLNLPDMFWWLRK